MYIEVPRDISTRSGEMVSGVWREVVGMAGRGESGDLGSRGVVRVSRCETSPRSGLDKGFGQLPRTL
jgi:hypothetical protein